MLRVRKFTCASTSFNLFRLHCGLDGHKKGLKTEEYTTKRRRKRHVLAHIPDYDYRCSGKKSNRFKVVVLCSVEVDVNDIGLLILYECARVV